MNTIALQEAIKESGLKKTFLANKLGVSMPTFRSKVNGLTAMTYDEAVTMKLLLGMTETKFKEIFN